MRRAIMLFVVILLLGGGGIAVWKVGLPYLAEREAAAAAAAPAPERRFLALEPFMVPLIREGVVTQHLTLSIELEVRDDDGVLLIEARTPQLRDAFLTELYGLYALRYVQEHLGNLQFTKDRLIAAGNHVLGQEIVTDILITGIETRKLQRRGA